MINQSQMHLSVNSHTMIINQICFNNLIPSHSVDCGTGEWACDDGSCIFNAFVCDGTHDCNDGSDEEKTVCDIKQRTFCSILHANFTMHCNKLTAKSLLNNALRPTQTLSKNSEGTKLC